MNVVLTIVTHPIYIVACLLVGVIWRRRRMGFVGSTLMAFLLTPLLWPLLLYISGPSKPSDPEARAEEELEAELERRLAAQRAAEIRRATELERAHNDQVEAEQAAADDAAAEAAEQPPIARAAPTPSRASGGADADGRDRD